MKIYSGFANRFYVAMIVMRVVVVVVVVVIALAMRGKKLRIAVPSPGGVWTVRWRCRCSAAGHRKAIYLQIWFQDDSSEFWDQCPWEEDVMVAKRVCERLRVPLRTVHFTDDYWNLVVKQSVEEIQRGKTPNPDILCNSRVKFEL